MKKVFVLLFLASYLLAAEAPFHRGANFTNWLQASDVRAIQFNKFTKQDFINAKSLGCDVIRLPINLHYMTNGEPDYTIDPLFYFFLDQVIDWSESLQMHLILDNHTFSVENDTDPAVGDILVKVWKQVAEHYKNRSNLIYYEVLNEPHGIDDAVWNAIQQRVVNAIREVDQKHTIVIGPAGWNSYNNLELMPEYDDDNLIYTFHFYDPFLFTHQGATWSDMGPLAGVPFPYDADRMPQCPPELADTWVKGSLEYTYPKEGNEEYVKKWIDIAVKFKNERNAKIFCGEFGVYIPNADKNDRVYWYNLVRNYFEENGIAWTIWDYTGGFGIFEQGGNNLFEYDLNVPLCNALGFTPPEQKEFEMKPDTAGFDVYMDFIGKNISNGSNTSGSLNFYAEENPVSGKYCIHWANASQYQNIAFYFTPNKDLSALVDGGYALDFWVRCNTATDLKFDVRFVDTKTGDDDHPWRIYKTIDQNTAWWDGQWNHLQIPLSDFQEHGSWDGQWYSPIGAFDWHATNNFEIVSEHGAMTGIDIYFDNIRIVDPKITEAETEPTKPVAFQLEQNYPNPFNPGTTITFTVDQAQPVELSVYNIAGKKIATLINGKVDAGSHQIQFEAKNLASGIYLYKLSAAGQSTVRSMLYLK